MWAVPGRCWTGCKHCWVTARTGPEQCDEEVPGEHAPCHSPTLLVAGDNDVFGPDWLERHRELVGLAPNDTVLIPEAGHLVIAEQPDATSAGLLRFSARGEATAHRV